MVRIRELADQENRFGYWRTHVLLRRDGFQVNLKRNYRRYREGGPALKREGGSVMRPG